MKTLWMLSSRVGDIIREKETHERVKNRDESANASYCGRRRLRHGEEIGGSVQSLIEAGHFCGLALFESWRVADYC